MKPIFKKALCVLSALAVCLPSAAMCASAADGKDYIIGNPYAEVEWGEWNSYKTQLHCHTNASDGASTIADTVEAYYAADYDILALTDHMTLGVQWDQKPQVVSLMRLIKYQRTGFKELVPLTSQRRNEILTGVGRDGRPMLEVTTGVELNGAVPQNSHINGYFSDYGQGLIGIDGDYETPAAEVGKRGGITFIDHIGDYTHAGDKNDPSISKQDEYVRKYSRIFLDNPSCVGTGINSAMDLQTKWDRVIYDEILQKTVPYGVVPWSFSFSDSHSDTIDQIDRAFTVHLMKELSVPELRRSMEEGTFFAVCRYARAELGEDYAGVGAYPTVSRISVDERDDTIKINASNYNRVVWVSNGVEIAEGAEIDLDDYADQVGCYVRAYIVGPGGVCYVQPFTVNVEGETLEKEEIAPVHNYSYILRKIITFLDNYVFSENSLVRKGWNWLASDWGFTIPNF